MAGKTQLKSYRMIENKLDSLLVTVALFDLIALWYHHTSKTEEFKIDILN